MTYPKRAYSRTPGRDRNTIRDQNIRASGIPLSIRGAPVEDEMTLHSFGRESRSGEDPGRIADCRETPWSKAAYLCAGSNSCAACQRIHARRRTLHHGFRRNWPSSKGDRRKDTRPMRRPYADGAVRTTAFPGPPRCPEANAAKPVEVWRRIAARQSQIPGNCPSASAGQVSRTSLKNRF